MTDLSRGIIEIEGVVLSQNTKASDFDNISNPNVKVKISKRGHTYVKFLKPISANSVDMYVEVNCYKDSDTPEITLFPVIPTELVGKYEEIAKYKLEASKKWLKGIINDIPNEDSESISYSFDWGYIISMVLQDRDYGARGGEININFREG